MFEPQEVTTESLEVTREEFFRETNMEERSTASSSNQSSKSSRVSPIRGGKGGMGVKNRLANMLRPRTNRVTSVPAVSQSAAAALQEQSRVRADSSASAPVTWPAGADVKRVSSNVSARHSTPRRSHSSAENTPSHAPERRKLRAPAPPSDSSVVSDNMTVEGLKSVATYQTISSLETVKASNKTELTEDKIAKQEAQTPWEKIRRALIPSKANSSPESLETTGASMKGCRARVQSFESKYSYASLSAGPALPRTQSSGDKVRSSSEPDVPSMKAMETASLDQCVRGRLDGIEVMALGSALWSNSFDCSIAEKTKYPWEDIRYTVTGQSTLYSPAELVKDMLWAAGGRPKPEIVLEGFLPGPEDRWTVQIERLQNPKYAFTYALENVCPPLLQAASTDENTVSTATMEDQDSPGSSSHKLWTSLWGSDPIPCGQPSRELLTRVANIASGDATSTNGLYENELFLDDPLLSLAADSSIPIDIDEDTFIVSTRDHMMAIQDIASVPIAEGRFETALRILEKLLLGLDSEVNNGLKYARGATFHNIGLIQMWQGDLVEANAAFAEALKERKKHMANHMDVVVTQSRLAQSCFALGRFDEAIQMLEGCLSLVDEYASVIRAKILNNLAVVHYHKNETSKSLRYLAQALEEQREYLEVPIRRESIVYDASVVLSNMGKLYLGKEDFELCSNVYEEALLLQTSILRKEHPSVIQSYVNLAWSKSLCGHSRTALRLLESCHRVQTAHYGADASATMETAGWMAHLYARAERYREAVQIYQRIRQWQKQHLKKTQTSLFFISGLSTPTHPSVRIVKDALKRIEDIAAPKVSITAWL